MGTCGINVKGLTLIELIIAIAITAFFAGITVIMLKTSFEAYFLGQEETSFVKVLDETLEEIVGGGIESNGIKDSLEIIDVTPASITFVPLWIDDTHMTTSKHEYSELVTKTPFILNRPFKPGASLPIAEIHTPDGWEIIPVTFVFGLHKDSNKPDDKIYLKNPVRSGTKIRFVYQVDAANFPDCAITIGWRGDRITRAYKGVVETIPKYDIPGVTLSDLNFQYFDNTNTEVEPRQKFIPNITAIKVNLKVQAGSQQKDGFAFINLRNTRTAGSGLIIQKGTRLKIPNSKNIRVFTLGNIIGIKRGGTIELEARPEKGTVWNISVELDYYNNAPVLRKYYVRYPTGKTVYSEVVNLTLDLPLNFMNLGATGRYDYDYDEDTDNIVNLEGDVELVVTRMDASGAALFIRP